MVEVVDLVSTIKQYPNAMRLVGEMLLGNIGEVKPAIDLSTELGFTYPQVENLLGVTTEEALNILDFWANNHVLEKQFQDKLQFCPYCWSPNFRPGLCCPKCGSENIIKGRILEHFSCGNTSLEDEYVADGKYVCPKCKKKLGFLGRDYRSLGISYKCHNCGKVSSGTGLKRKCHKCSLLFADSGAKETLLHSYRINAEKKPWLEFELRPWWKFEIGPKARLIDFLKNQGYEVTERARITGTSKSGAEHMLDILARRDDGFVAHTVGIGIAIDGYGREIGLDEVFAFDDKAYDLGINDKVLLASPRLSAEAKQFAQRQRIKVFEDKDLETFLTSAPPSARRQMNYRPFKFDTKAKLLKHLKNLGYRVEEKAKVRGKSGTEHVMDILASYDNGFITNTIGIDVIAAKNEIGLDAVSSFDTKAYDLGIHHKVLFVSPRLSQKANKFAQYQKITVITADDSTKLSNANLSRLEGEHD
jgi:predicted RNA-binding Zn-ribbon protein involved in translation (DUF1610 family)